MSIRIELDTPNALFTNLDFLTGRLILSLTHNQSVAAITVKLEGESKTRLVGNLPAPHGYGYGGGSYRRRDESTVESEVHKILYKAIRVFPTNDMEDSNHAGVWSVLPGQHTFPFKFKLPINNSCADGRPRIVSVVGIQMQTPGSSDHHTHQTLPPTLHAFQEQAIIRYYVKATVQRPSFYKENFRAVSESKESAIACFVLDGLTTAQEQDFSFFPIEPPRPPPNRRESYARIQHHFAPIIDHPSSPKAPGFFRKGSTPKPDLPNLVPLSICIDGRLPDPAIITCHEPVPLKILVTKLNDSPAAVILSLLQIELVARTNVRAHHLAKDNLTSTVLLSKSNMHMRLREGDKLMEIDRGLWSNIPLPNTVAPSFNACNITRSYQLHVKVGLVHAQGDHVYPELTVQTLKMPVEVFSGIHPPQALLERRGSTFPESPHVTSTAHLSPLADKPPPGAPFSSASAPSSTSHEYHPPLIPSPVPIGSGQTHPEEEPLPVPDEPPPSYQDAIAEGIGPVSGVRRGYQH
ncbi:MAG: hypothetical protein Q9220_002505 [cf. Caloplaca sp. 1 TL-2023]